MIKGIIFDFNRTLFDPESQRLFGGVATLLPKLAKNYKLALLSTGNESRKQLIKSLAMEKYFREILVVLEKKEDHLTRLAEACKCQPQEILVVGDGIKSEIALAKSLGMRTVWLKKGVFANDEPAGGSERPDFVIFRLNELEKVLESSGKSYPR